MTTVQLLARSLARAGVRHAFGVPGGETLPLIEALHDEGVEWVLMKHETSAGFAAAAAAELGPAPGVCVSTLGPGATNLATGLAGALLDRAPVVAITGQISEALTHVYTHQTLDQLAVLRPLVKHQVTLTAAQAWREIPLALRQLHPGRPGPVHLNLPMDVAEAPHAQALDDRWAFAPGRPHPAALAAAREALAAARHPVIVAGLGARGEAVSRALTALAEGLGAPVLTTYKAKGLIDESHPLAVGACSLSTTVDAVHQGLLGLADLLVLVGLDPVELRTHWLPGWPPHLPVIAVDEAPPADLVHPVEHMLLGGVAETLDALAGGPPSAWEPLALDQHRARWAELFVEDAGEAMGPAAAITAARDALPADAIVTLDVGAHRISASHLWRCAAPGRLLQSNGLCSMGFGLPAAIAAALTRPGRRVMALTGDAGLAMCMGELGVAAHRGLDLTVLYLADASHALIALKQRRSGLPPRGMDFRNPEVGALAAAWGGEGVRATTPQEVGAAVRRAGERGGLQLIEALIDPTPYARQV